jgi:hypothetical protein
VLCSDSYSTTAFLNDKLKWISENVRDEQFTKLFIHSDNASQHFKNSKTLYWLSKRPSSTKRRNGSLSQLKKCQWSFGAPGHGKGVWDGLGGTVRAERSRTTLSELARVTCHMYVNSDTLELRACLQVKRILSQAQEHGLENPKAILCASKRISTAIEAHEHLHNLFASEEWTRGHAEKTVGQYVALWRDSSSIERPCTNVDHGCCEDIRESRSFLATCSSGKRIVLLRKWDCWCDACLQTSGRGEGNMSGCHCAKLNCRLSQLEVQRCVGPGPGP